MLKVFSFILATITLGYPTLGQTTNKSTRPNILCILVDDLGYGDLSVQGAADMQTPAIDNLAQHGLTFTNFYANSTVCSPSRAALLTGQYPDMVGVPGVIRQIPEDNWGNLMDQSLCIAEVLRENGYDTAMIGKWHLGLQAPDLPNKKGFQLFKGFLGDMMDDYWTHLRGGINWMRHNETEINPEGHATDIFTDWTIEFLNNHHKADQPFFLYLAYNAPHFPIQPPKEWLDQVMERQPNSSEKRAKNVALIEHLDYNIGRIMKVLKETGLDQNTLIVFTSDNGGALRYAQSNGRLRGGKQDMYEGGIRVPTFFYWKNKILPNSTTPNLAMLMDLFPTFCEVAEIDVPQSIDGISLLPSLLGKPQSTNTRYLFWVRREGWHYGGQAYYAARYGDLKILQNTPFEPVQAFDLKNDPYEKQPLNPSDMEQYQDLRFQLQNHIRKAGAIPWQ
ncbi:sulfatase [Aestuariivivens sediminis]|uniref:sulfatase family protein n=1 Tax=Aestuariivivens sediminis TaxID=2913557 RepID=UPI001F59F0AF|nr:sulfatase-like hydrolase/transferase [Aestuariivivens sediminis]